MTTAVAIGGFGNSFLAYNDDVLIMGSFRDCATPGILKDKLKHLNYAIDRGDFSVDGDALKDSSLDILDKLVFKLRKPVQPSRFGQQG
jgi:hypothetical protein